MRIVSFLGFDLNLEQEMDPIGATSNSWITIDLHFCRVRGTAARSVRCADAHTLGHHVEAGGHDAFDVIQDQEVMDVGREPEKHLIVAHADGRRR